MGRDGPAKPQGKWRMRGTARSPEEVEGGPWHGLAKGWGKNQRPKRARGGCGARLKPKKRRTEKRSDSGENLQEGHK